MSWFSKMFTKTEGQATRPEGEEREIPADEADEVLPEDSRSLLRQLISANGLSMGMDLSKVALPTFILEPRSLLEKLGDTVMHPEIFANLAAGTSPEARMKDVVRWYFAAYHVRPKGTKKPFNPVLGETFAAQYTPASVYTSNASVTWRAQQVSHHPPVSAFFARNATGSVVMQGCFAPKSKFLGNSAASLGGGGFRFYMPEHDEVYYLTWPSVYVRGVLFGTLLMEVCGPVSIVCPKTKLIVNIEFHAKGFFGGTYHHVTGHIIRGDRNTKKSAENTVCTIDGNWTEKVVSTMADGSAETLFDASAQPVGSCTELPMPADDRPETQRMWSSRVVWHDTASAIEGADQPAATAAKQALEQYQRELRKKREEAGEVLKPSLFDLDEQSGEWNYVGPDAVALPPVETPSRT